MGDDVLYTVIGMRVSSFKDKETNKEVVYGRVYATYTEDNQTVGSACKIFKVNPEKFVDLKPGDSVVPYYNEYGRVKSLQKVNPIDD